MYIHNRQMDMSTRHIHLTMHTIKAIIMPVDITDNDAKIAWRIAQRNIEIF